MHLKHCWFSSKLFLLLLCQVLSQSVSWNEQEEAFVESGSQIVIPTNYPGTRLFTIYKIFITSPRLLFGLVSCFGVPQSRRYC